MRLRLIVLGLAVLAVVTTSFAPSGASAQPPTQPGLDKTTLVVMFHDQALPADLESFAASQGALVEDVWTELGGAVLKVRSDQAGESLLEALLARADVATAEFDFQWRIHATPNDSRYPIQWAPKTVKLPAAYDELASMGLPTFGAHSVRIAVLDTGADLDHEDLAANICANKNFLMPNTPAEDDNDHGSHTAGIAAAATNNGIGIAGAGNSCLYIGKVCDEEGGCDISKVGSAISWAINPDGNPATDDKVHIVSMSFGGLLGSGGLQLAMTVAYAQGILLVASAGNDVCGPVGYPAAYAQVMAVAALEIPLIIGPVMGTATGQTEIRAPYSNCGPDVEIAAPGSNILSTIRNNGYAAFSGTSMSAPQVAGIAGLVKLANPALTNVQVRCVLDQTAQDYGAPKRDLEFGHGKVRADRAVIAAATGASCVNYELGLGIGAQNLIVAQTPPL